MSRVIEGSTRGGFQCDAGGCGRKATHSPVACVPLEGYPVRVRKPIIAFVDTHVCPDHWRAVNLTRDVFTKKMRQQIEAVAAESGLRPDFRRAYLKWCRCISSEYQQFQEKSGLVPPGDADADGRIIIPNVLH